MTLAATPSSRYCYGTTSMQVDPEAPLDTGGASESFLGGSPKARCTGRVDLDWVPDVEYSLVPEQMAPLCAACLTRAECLTWAMSTRSKGYWAGTTTADRKQLAAEGQPTDLRRADQIQCKLRTQAAEAAAVDLAGALPPVGQGSLWWYRRGCRCRQCRRCNAERRAEERARRAEVRGTSTVPELPSMALQNSGVAGDARNPHDEG
jgi:hypothetical protein